MLGEQILAGYVGYQTEFSAEAECEGKFSLTDSSNVYVCDSGAPAMQGEKFLQTGHHGP